MIECATCKQQFNPANFSEVIDHEHLPMPGTLIPDIRGIFVGKTYTEQESGNVAKIWLNRDDTSVDITYRNGNTYRWLDVPVDVMETAEHAPSIGAWLNRTLKGKYRYFHMNGD